MRDQWRPPRWVIRLANHFVRPLLRSPLHRILSGRLMLLRYVGRSSGRPYTTPVGYFGWDDGNVISFSSAGWWRSLRDGRPVSVLVRGRLLAAVPTVEESLEARADALGEFVRRYGPRLARRFYLGLPRGRAPTRQELLRAAAGRAVVTFRPVGRW